MSLKLMQIHAHVMVVHN